MKIHLTNNLRQSWSARGILLSAACLKLPQPRKENMNETQTHDRQIRILAEPQKKKKLLLAVATLLLAIAYPGQAGPGSQGNPGILPPNSIPYGQTYGEWMAAH